MTYFNVDDVIQVIAKKDDTTDNLTGALLQVTEVKPWGVQAVMTIPYRGLAYFRLNNDEIERVGEAPLHLEILEKGIFDEEENTNA